MTVVFFNDTATTEIYTLSLHVALPILLDRGLAATADQWPVLRTAYGWVYQAARLLANPEDQPGVAVRAAYQADRKSTRLNSSHANISYAVFCLKKIT